LRRDRCDERQHENDDERILARRDISSDHPGSARNPQSRRTGMPKPKFRRYWAA